MREKVSVEFESILFCSGSGTAVQSHATVQDLALDQVFAAIGRDAPLARAAFEGLLLDPADVAYRQDVFRALEHDRVRAVADTFLRDIDVCQRRREASASAHYRYEREIWHLRAVVGYVDAVEALVSGLAGAVADSPGSSAGWEALARHASEYRASAVFGALEAEAIALDDDLGRLRFDALIRGSRVSVATTDGESDLGVEVTQVFARFRQGEVSDHRTQFREPSLDHVQAWVLENVAKVHAQVFEQLQRFAATTEAFQDPTLMRFADEVRFYLAYLDFVAPLQRAGLPVTYPVVTAESKRLVVSGAWDLALAARLVENGSPVVTNDLSLTGPERILVISGPNQGGKTTMARVFGQIHYLAAIGCPVPGAEAEIPLCGQIVTVFEREEQLDTLEGRLGAEIGRLHAAFEDATERTVFVINEAFASTALQDARILTRDVLERICALGALGVCVTFIDELSRLNEHTVSMVSTVDPHDPAVRTFQVERRDADGRAFAHALAAKHGLTEAQVRNRIIANAGTHRSGSVPAGEGEDER